MLKLNAPSVEQRTIELLPGVEVVVRPITVAMILIGRAAAGEVFRADPDAPDLTTHASVALVRSLAQQGIAEWRGVGNEAGEPIPVSPEAVDLLLNHWQAFDAIDRLYVAPALNAAAEGNG